MKTPEEIKHALRCKGFDEECDQCAYRSVNCGIKAELDALAYIEQLEEQIQLMKIQMHGDCGVCKHRSNAQVTPAGPRFSGPCYTCMQKESRPNWEYEGLPEVKIK